MSFNDSNLSVCKLPTSTAVACLSLTFSQLLTMTTQWWRVNSKIIDSNSLYVDSHFRVSRLESTRKSTPKIQYFWTYQLLYFRGHKQELARDGKKGEGHSLGRSANRQTESEPCTRLIYQQAVSHNVWGLPCLATSVKQGLSSLNRLGY